MYRLFFLFLFIACKSTDKTVKLRPIRDNEQAHTAFYYFQVSKNKDSIIQVYLQKIKRSPAKTKGYYPNTIIESNKVNGNWLVSFSGSTPIYQLQIKDPLLEDVEYIDSNGNFTKQRIYHKEKSFVLRIPYQNSIKTITFEKILRNKNVLQTHVINQIKL